MKSITIQVTRDEQYAVKLQLPATYTEIEDFYRQLNKISKDGSTTKIEKADCKAEYLERYIKEYLNVDNRAHLTMLNALAYTLNNMNEEQLYLFSCTLNPHKINSFQDVLRLSESQSDYILLKGMREVADFGHYLVDNNLIIFPEQVKPYLNYGLVGERFSTRYGGGLGPFEIDFSKRGYAAPKQVLEGLKDNPIQIMDSMASQDWPMFVRKQFPQGSRIRLKEMKDPYAPVAPGTMGTLEDIDDAGNIHVQWDNGRTLSLVPGVDHFAILPPEPTTLKLYMPLTADLYERNRYGDLDEDSALLDGRGLLDFEDRVLAAMIKHRGPEESERGLMNWYDKQDGVDDKVRSAVFTAEVRERQLWGVAECRVVGTLTPEELDALKEYISGQASDGWGEGFEQREITMPDGGELYVHLWSSEYEWSIETEQERFAPKLAEGLPELCFSVLPGEGKLICIKRGEKGYYPSEWETGDPTKNRELADANNERLGVSKAQEEAMLTGSMMGWDCPGADPARYEESGQPQKGGLSLG